MRSPEFSYYNGPIYQDLPRYVEPSMQRGRVFLVAVHGEQVQTSARGSFDRVHVMVVDPNQMANLSHPLSVLCALPDIKAGGVSPAIPPRGLLAVKSRPVLGEILCNQEGQFYERSGNRLVPLRQLVSGPQGQVIEFLPPAARRPRWNDTIEDPECIEIDESPMDASAATEAAPKSDFPVEDTRRSDFAIRKVFPEPGQLRLLNYGDFSGSLAPQLKNPSRLRETHQLPCYLQVFEIRRPVALQGVAASLGKDQHQLLRLTPLLAQKLGLSSLIPALTHIPPVARPVLMPGEMVCGLQVVRDPTAELECAPREEITTDQSAVAQPRTSSPARKSIPPAYLKPWEFKLSREEALYDMNSLQASRGWFRRLFALFRKRVRRSDFERWSSLLANKNADEQLWAVRPPTHSLNKPQIRHWALQVLAAAGYDAQSMLAEWEIYWRRKGLC